MTPFIHFGQLLLYPCSGRSITRPSILHSLPLRVDMLPPSNFVSEIEGGGEQDSSPALTMARGKF
jgi:hypothetical protein